MLVCLSILILWALCEIPMRDRQKALIYVLLRCFNCQWLKGDAVGQKILFKVSWNWIFLFIASTNPGGRGRRWVQDFHLLSQGFESFPLDHRDWVGLIQCVCSICRWLRQKWLVYVLLEFDAAVGEGCGIWEHLHSFREVKWERGVSPRFYLLVLCMV